MEEKLAKLFGSQLKKTLIFILIEKIDLVGEEMKSPLNFIVKKDGKIFDMHELGIWVSSFHIYSPNLNRTKSNISGRAGSYLVATKEEERHVRIRLQVETDYIQEFDELKHKIFDLFFSKEEITIIRDIAPDKEIYVIQEGEYDIENISDSDGEFELILTMLDPYIYGAEHKYIIPSGNNIFDIENPGAEAEPKFKITVNQDITFLSVVRDDNFVMIGKPQDEENETKKQPLEVVMEDDMATTSGWTSANTYVENGDVTGSFSSNDSYFYASNFGTGSLWHGPALKKSLPAALQDFQVEFIVEFKSNGDPKKMGRAELILLDANNQTVAKLAMKDVFQGYAENHAEMRVGNISTGTRLIDGGPAKKDDWDDFYGMLRLSREGNIWRAYVAVIDSKGKHVKTRSETFTDHKNQYTAQIAQVMVHIAQRGTIPVADMRIHKVKVFKRNNLGANEIPVIARAGDVIEFDHESAMVYKNGEDFRTALDLSSDFFTLKPGTNRLSLLPEGAGDVEITFRERFL
jgi:phage-related protein